MHARPFAPLAAAILFLGLATPFTIAHAQCGPDGLNGGPCCAPAGVVLPQFPATTMTARWICFDTCQSQFAQTYCSHLGAPNPMQSGGALVCGAYTIRVQLRDCGTTGLIWNGSVNAFYSRNWQASSLAGAINLNVWRFVVNGDLLPGPALPTNNCQRPDCMNQFARLHVSGYVDYAFDCLSGTWQAAWMLTHECDSVHHAAGTARPAPPGGFHPTRSYTVVAPDGGFVVSPASPNQSNGAITQQALRKNNWATSPQICTFEEACAGVFQAQQQFCQCVPTGLSQYVTTVVNAGGACGSSVAPSAIGLFEQKRIGRWTNSAVYPGGQFVLFDFGWLSTTDGCTGAGSQEWYEGVETIRGYLAYDFAGNPLGNQFEDLASANLSATSQAPRIGAPHVAYWLLNFNL
jgi:hypothetical protein